MLLTVVSKKKGITPLNIIDSFDFHKKEGMFMQDNVMKVCKMYYAKT